MSGRPRIRWVIALLGLATAVAIGFWTPTVYAADRGLIAFEPVDFDGKIYTGNDKGPFTKDYPKGLDKNDPDAATATLDTDVKQGVKYPWGSIGAKNGSFIENKTGKPICKIVITSTDGNTFDTAPQAGAGWTVEVSKDKKTITFTAKEAKNCIPNGGWFWIKVPKSPQPGSGTPPTLEGSIAMAATQPAGETAVVALTDDDAFVASLSGLDAYVAATATPSPEVTATVTSPATPDASPVAVTPTPTTIDAPAEPGSTTAPTPIGHATLPTGLVE